MAVAHEDWLCCGEHHVSVSTDTSDSTSRGDAAASHRGSRDVSTALDTVITFPRDAVPG